MEMVHKLDLLKQILWKAEAGRKVAARTIEPFPISSLLSRVSYHSGWVKGLWVWLR